MVQIGTRLVLRQKNLMRLTIKIGIALLKKVSNEMIQSGDEKILAVRKKLTTSVQIINPRLAVQDLIQAMTSG